MGQEVKQKSLGEKRIRIDFSESQIGDTGTAKERIAGLINLLDAMEQKDGEHGRLKSIAITELENASMWITKAFTY
jgi:hypothetical protein